jgi:organic radical activating enzyme
MLRIFNAKWTSLSAGPSPDRNRRTEIFLAGCKKAAEGYPCPGCFNVELWSSEAYVASQSPEEAFQHIKKHAPNKYITFVGGEPLDQLTPLSYLCKMLHEDGFHIIVITHYSIENLWANSSNSDMSRLLNNIDIIIDGEYDASQRIWDDSKAGDGLHDVIGSGNQRICDMANGIAIKAGNIESWKIDKEHRVIFVRKKMLA